jgi:hypothetical protein
MLTQDLPETDPIASHAYSLPTVREVPIGTRAPSDAADPPALDHPVGYAADAHAW